jgi:cytidylate kinase
MPARDDEARPPAVMSRPRRPRGLVIAIDGPSGAGKSTAGRALAERLGYTFLDTGAMYRALALKALRAGVPLGDGEALAALARQTRIDLVDGGRGVLLDGADVTGAIRTAAVTAAASRVSALGPVRREMVARQQDLGRRGGVVLDGRDIGTAVFPDAEVKFYVDADPRRRAQRRREELFAAGTDTDLEEVEREIRARDHADSTRADSPLTRAPDAIAIETSALTPEEVVERMLSVVRERAARGEDAG